MKKRKKSVIVLSCLLAFLLVATPGAQAVKVENVTAGTTIFDSGGFEGETAGVAPSAPVAGFYQNNPFGIVRDGATPGAYEGSNYNQLGSPGLAETYFGAVPAGEAIRISYALNIGVNPGDTPEFRMRLTGGAAGNSEVAIIDMQPTTGGTRVWSTTTGYPSGVHSEPINNFQWFEVIMDHVVGSADLTLSVNGVSELMTGVVKNTTSLERIRWDNIQPGYVDSIPEPISMALLGLGGLMTLRRRRA